MNSGKYRLRPSKMYEPNPPAPINEANVAQPIKYTVDRRIPAIIIGMANGISTFRIISQPFIPMPRPASKKFLSTSFTPVYVFRKIGSTEEKNNAIIAGTYPTQKGGTKKASIARLGKV